MKLAAARRTDTDVYRGTLKSDGHKGRACFVPHKVTEVSGVENKILTILFGKYIYKCFKIIRETLISFYSLTVVHLK